MPAKSDRSLFDRILSTITPTHDPEYVPPPRSIADGLWIIERRLRMPPRMILPANSALIRLASGGLLAWSPCEPGPQTVKQIQELGSVEAIVAPNSFHHLFVPAFARAFPAAQLLLAPGLFERVDGLPSGTSLADPLPAFLQAELDVQVFGPVKGFAEAVILHRPTQTLFLVDLAFNVRTYSNAIQKMMWRIQGMPPEFGPSRLGRMTLLRDREAAVRHLRAIREWEFRRIVVAHGEPIEQDAKGAFERGYAAFLGNP